MHLNFNRCTSKLNFVKKMSNPTGTTKKQKLAPVRVFLRIRPAHAQDGASAITYCTPKEICVKGHSKTYSFDQIFDDKTSQKKVYKTVVESIISDVVKGYNCTIFAYGQTGTGKTFTIIGGDTVNSVDQQFDRQGDSDAGIILRAAKHLYDELDKIDQSVQYTVTVSFMEIYNEEIRDLLCDKEVVPLRIYEDKTKTVRVKNLQEVTVLNINDIFGLLKKGCEKRQIASTLMNDRSSRSHTVFTINVSTIQTISVAGNLTNIICGKLSLIDLAGSENIAKSGSKDQRAREATSINQSLLTLGRVIKALVENSSHVPYRESKLTRILQDSLGGKTKTVIIATISPGVSSLEETVNTLEYAFSARHVTNCPTINLRTSATAVAVHEEVIRLKRDLFATANEQGVYMDKENYEEMNQSLSQFRKDIVSKHETIKYLTEKLDDLLAQKEEWDNLRISFEITRQAYQECQSEFQSTKGMMKKDKLLLDYYENEIAETQKFTDLMAKRENYLKKKVDVLYGTTISNKEATEKIIKSVEDALDVILSQDSQNSLELRTQVERLIHFNENVSHMLTNVEKQLDDRANHCTDICINLVSSQNQPSDDPFLKLGNCFYEFTDHTKNIFRTLIKICDSKANQFNQRVEETKKNISIFELLVQNSEETGLNEFMAKEVEIEKNLSEDLQQTNNFFEKIENSVKEKMGHLAKIFSEANDQLTRDKEALRKREEQMLGDMESLKKREEQLLQDKESLKSRCEEICRDQEELTKREQRQLAAGQLIQGQSYRGDFAKYIKERRKKKENICDFSILKKNISSNSQKLLHTISTMNNELVQTMEKSDIPQTEEIMTHTEKMQSQFTLMMEHLLQTIANNNSDMARVIRQISSILDIEGNVHLEQLNEMVDSQVHFYNDASKEIKLRMHQMFHSSFIPVSHTGNTPQPMQAPQPIRRSRDSIVRKLIMDKSISTEDPKKSSS